MHKQQTILLHDLASTKMELNVDVAGLMVDRLARMSLHYAMELQLGVDVAGHMAFMTLAQASKAILGTPRRSRCGCQEVGQEDFRGQTC